MSEVVERTEACERCGLQALVTREETKNGAGVVITSVSTMVQCTNPECVHYAARAVQELGAGQAEEPSKLTKRQRDAFERREGEDAYAWVARTHRTLRFNDLPQLLMLRNNDRKQVEAIQLLAQLKMVKWTRALTFGTFFLGACTIVAALLARG